eukprot:CAMPEP_0175163216 /NCGR_PEP_ID=MMETSP0087-20121206/25620_1 /TAXON_ID=136419 /ORGANISM="Unknown Unknown, Strain D1" /LENGTH=766 /DNA_ID=CAMNT_0016451883 /DNA_START=323 /DNA_END=2623 /DNA_ORIENTATION=+
MFGGSSESSKGVLPRAADYLFTYMEKADLKFDIYVSMFDICKGTVRDLGTLVTKNADGVVGQAVTLDVPHDIPLETAQKPAGGGGDDKKANKKVVVKPVIPDLVQTMVKSPDALKKFVATAIATRQPFETDVGYDSGRKRDNEKFACVHTVVMVSAARKDNEDIGLLTLVDLAGAECEVVVNNRKTHERVSAAAQTLQAFEKVCLSLNGAAAGDDTAGRPPFSSSLLTKILGPSFGRNTCHSAVVNLDLDGPGQIASSSNALDFAHLLHTRHPPDKVAASVSDPRFRALQQQYEQLRVQMGEMKEMYERKLNILGANGPSMARPTSALRQPISEPKQPVDAAAAGDGGEERSSESKSKIKELTERLKGAEKLIAEANDKANTHKKKAAKKILELNELQTQYRSDQEAFSKEAARYRKIIDDLKTQVATSKQKLMTTTQQFQEERTEFTETLTKTTNDIVKEQNDRVRTLTQAFRTDNSAELIRSIRREADQKVERERAVCNSLKKQEITNITEQYEYYLREKTESLQQFVTEYQRYKSDKEAEIEECEKELKTLYEFVSRLTEVMCNIDEGRYPVTEKYGIARFDINEISRKLVGTEMTRVSKLNIEIKKLDQLLKRAAPPQGALQATDDSLKLDVLQDLQKLKKQLLEELASDQTVQYIRQVEDERDHYKQKLLRETKKRHSLRIAHESQNRVLHQMSVSGSPSRSVSASPSRVVSASPSRTTLTRPSSAMSASSFMSGSAFTTARSGANSRMSAGSPVPMHPGR